MIMTLLTAQEKPFEMELWVVTCRIKLKKNGHPVPGMEYRVYTIISVEEVKDGG